MSIVAAIDERIAGVEAEISFLDEKLAGANLKLEDLRQLREKAAAVETEDVEAGEAAQPPAAKQPPAAPRSTTQQAADAVLAVVKASKDEGVARRDVVERTDLPPKAIERALRDLVSAGLIDPEGAGRGRRYYPKGETERPNEAPARERRAASAPARRTQARRNTAAAEAHEALRGRVEEAILAALADGAKGKKPLKEAVLEAVPEASEGDFRAQLRTMLGKTRKLELKANKVWIANVDRSKPITGLEQEVVACLGSGKTAREVAEACEQLRDAFTARSVLAALAIRGVVISAPGKDGSTVYVTAATATEAA